MARVLELGFPTMQLSQLLILRIMEMKSYPEEARLDLSIEVSGYLRPSGVNDYTAHSAYGEASRNSLCYLQKRER